MSVNLTSDQFSDLASSTVAGGSGGGGTSLQPGDTTLLLAAGTGGKFPGSGPCYGLLGATTTNPELVRVTSRANDTVTIVRAQGGTSAALWAVGTTFDHVATAENWQNVWSALQSLAAQSNADAATIAALPPANLKAGALPAGVTIAGSQVTGDVAASQIGPGALDSDVTITASQITGGVPKPTNYQSVVNLVSSGRVPASGVTLGVTGLITGETGTAASFDGASGHCIQLPAEGLPAGNLAWTVEAIVKPTNANSGSADGPVVVFGTPGNNGQAAGLTQKGSGGWAAFTWNGDATGGSSTAGSTYHLAATWDGTTLTLYVNGSSVATATPGARLVSPLFAYIGGEYYLYNGNSSWAGFNGVIERVAIYPTALSSARVSAHYSAFGSSASNYDSAVLADTPLHFWKLADAAGSTVVLDTLYN